LCTGLEAAAWIDHGEKHRSLQVAAAEQPLRADRGRVRKTRFVGIAKTQLAADLVGATYNLLRMARLQPATG
jgi:hypothetical protein